MPSPAPRTTRRSRLLALLLLPPAALAGRGDRAVTKTFKFKDDFFLEFRDLPTAIGPDAADVLLAALNDGFAATFRDAWIDAIETSLEGGDCTVDKLRVRDIEFSLCEWRYPDKYDVDELPTPGQCYDYPDQFVQRLYYAIDKLEITCPDNFSYDDLDKTAYMEAAFAGSAFRDVLRPPGQSCDGDAPACLFADVDAVDYVDGYEACTAELHINRYMDVPVYLRCLDMDGYGRRVANQLIRALDRYFATVVVPVLEERIYNQAPEAFVYNIVSPYDSDRQYCAHGAYYAGGNLRDQVADEDGVLVTKFTYGFDVIWYKPGECGADLLPDVELIINEVFADGDFLLFLQEEFPDYDFVQDIDFCDVVDPTMTFPPTVEVTPAPTAGPLCDLATNEGCDGGRVCRLSCVWGTSEPQCFDDDEERDCTDKYGPGWVCRDSDGDGSVDGADHSNGCEYRAPTGVPTFSPPTGVPTLLPSTASPTRSPTLSPSTSPTTSPTLSPSTSPTLSPTRSPSDVPTPSPVTDAPTKRASTPFPTDNPVTVAPTGVPTGVPTRVPTGVPTVPPTGVPTNVPTGDPTRDPTPVPSSSRPTLQPTSGDTETVGGDATLLPTILQIRPAETYAPTLLGTPRPTCPMCIVYPDDKDEDECPLVTTGTCGDGDRGDGMCPYAGHCCSQWGYCGTTPLYCDGDSVAPSPSGVVGAPQSPTYAVDAGQCAGGNLGDEFCADDSLCCSDWGYCGSGENYCFQTKWYDEGPEEEYGTCGGGGTGNGVCAPGLCCSKYGFCGEGELYCTGQNQCTTDEEDLSCYDEAEIIINSNPLPEDLLPEFGYRCGFSEVDARGNCKPECTHHVQCSDGEECWGVQLNYCYTYRELEHPMCTDLDLADTDKRCGLDEASARGHCGVKCSSDDECEETEYCFPTMLNLCECHEETCPEESAAAFSRAKELISPYFVQSENENSVEGKPRSASVKSDRSIAASLLLVFASINILMM